MKKWSVNRRIQIVTLVVAMFGYSLISTQTCAQEVKILPLALTKGNHGAFGPFLKGDTLYFCSDMKGKAVRNVENVGGRLFLDLFSVRIKQKNKLLDKPQRLSDTINSRLNEGPLVISNDGKYLMYSKNIDNKKGDNVGVDDEFKLGLFTSEFVNGSWGEPVSFKYNHDSINLRSPALNETGDLLIFSSDHNIGFGKSDLYWSKKKDGEWQDPMNLGDSINTEFGESFPFIIKNKLYYTSNRDGGHGGYDIYVSDFKNGQWSKSELLDKPINSEFDDFCFFMKDAKSGYFSSNRLDQTDKVFYFEKKNPEPLEYVSQDMHFCYEFTDANMEDTTGLNFEWDLGDGTKKDGLTVEHCYADTGKYSVSLNIQEKSPNRIYENVASYDIEISSKGLPIIEMNTRGNETFCTINNKWSKKSFDSHYWLVKGEKIFEEKIAITLSDIGVVKLVLWNKKEAGSEIGIEYQVN